MVVYYHHIGYKLLSLGRGAIYTVVQWKVSQTWQTVYVGLFVDKYLYAKAIDEPVSAGQKMDYFISQPELSLRCISKSIPVGGPVLLEVQRSVESLHHNNPIVHRR